MAKRQRRRWRRQNNREQKEKIHARTRESRERIRLYINAALADGNIEIYSKMNETAVLRARRMMLFCFCFFFINIHFVVVVSIVLNTDDFNACVSFVTRWMWAIRNSNGTPKIVQIWRTMRATRTHNFECEYFGVTSFFCVLSMTMTMSPSTDNWTHYTVSLMNIYSEKEWIEL